MGSTSCISWIFTSAPLSRSSLTISKRPFFTANRSGVISPTKAKSTSRTFLSRISTPLTSSQLMQVQSWKYFLTKLKRCSEPCLKIALTTLVLPNRRARKRAVLPLPLRQLRFTRWISDSTVSKSPALLALRNRPSSNRRFLKILWDEFMIDLQTRIKKLR